MEIPLVLVCETCRAQNPATNRYCGQCGRRLEQTAADIPEEFWRGNGTGTHPHVEASADLPPEAIDFDNQIPLFAGEGTDRRLHPSPEIVEKVHDHLERESEMHDELQHDGETHFEAHRRQEAAQNQNDEEHGGFHIVNSGDASSDGTHAEQNFLSDGVKTNRTGVSGPSFLGLTDDLPPDYSYEEPEAESHIRRNIGLAVLACVMVLAALQWRSIRDYGVAYLQNGSMAIKPGQSSKNPPSVAADNTSRDLALPNAPKNPSEAQALQSSPNADHNLPVQQPAPSESAAQSDRRSGDNAVNVPPPAAMSSLAVPKNTDLPGGTERRDVSSATRENTASAANVSAAKSVESNTGRSASTATPGGDEMARALRASDPGERATWLWRAVGKGNPRASIELARMYEEGDGVVQNCDQALVLLRSAAAKGNEQARTSLQQMRFHGGCSVR